MTDAPYPFVEGSPLDRATRDPILALALLAEAVARGEADPAPYIAAANAALGYVDAHGFIRLPQHDAAEIEDVLGKPGAPAPHELYAQTGGGQAYIDAMIEHGYVTLGGAPPRT